VDESELLDREGRFTMLYRRYQPQILAYARRRLPEDDAVEVVAEEVRRAAQRARYNAG